MPFLVLICNGRQEGPEAEMRLSSHAFQMTEMCELFGGRRLQVCFFTARVAALMR